MLCFSTVKGLGVHTLAQPFKLFGRGNTWAETEAVHGLSLTSSRELYSAALFHLSMSQTVSPWEDSGYCCSAKCLVQSCRLQVAEKIESSAVKGSGRQQVLRKYRTQVKGRGPPSSNSSHSGIQAKPSHSTGPAADREHPKETSVSERNLCIRSAVFWSRASWESSFQSWQQPS